VKQSLISIVTVPIVTGVIGYVTNWTGVLMLFYPVHFKGVRAPWLQKMARWLPYKVRQIPGLMIGGIGWQGIIPSRAQKMGSLAVDSGIAKLGTPKEFFKQLDPEKIAEQIVESTREDVGEVVEKVMLRENPELWNDLPPQVKDLVIQRVKDQLPDIVGDLTEQIGDNIDQLVDVKLMVIKRFDPELANRVFLDMGKRELKFIQNFGFVFGFLVGIPVAGILYLAQLPWLLLPLGVIIGWVTNWVALWMIYEPPEWRRYGPIRFKGLFIRRQPEVSEVYAKIVSEEILTVAEFGHELLHGPQSDRTRILIEDAMRPAIDRAIGPARAAVRVAVGSSEYDAIRQAFATEPVERLMDPLTDREFSAGQAAAMGKLIVERMREMSPSDFGEMLRTATREDEWLLLLHGAVLGLAGGLIHLAIFG
jgi:uncharacterized membrane protein YheB (UPF0754 family)